MPATRLLGIPSPQKMILSLSCNPPLGFEFARKVPPSAVLRDLSLRLTFNPPLLSNAVIDI
jgi:hypothetical protein